MWATTCARRIESGYCGCCCRRFSMGSEGNAGGPSLHTLRSTNIAFNSVSNKCSNLSKQSWKSAVCDKSAANLALCCSIMFSNSESPSTAIHSHSIPRERGEKHKQNKNKMLEKSLPLLMFLRYAGRRATSVGGSLPCAG